MRYLLILVLCAGCFPIRPQEPVAMPVPARRLELSHEEAQAMIRLVLKERDAGWAERISHEY